MYLDRYGSGRNMKKLITVIISIVFLLCGYDISVSADIHSGFSSDAVDAVKQNSIFKGLEVQKTDQEYHGGNKISNFSVSNSHTVAIGFSSGEINIYNEKGEYQYGFHIKEEGSFRVLFDSKDQELIFYLVRGDYLVKIDKDGNLVEVRGALQTNANNSYTYELESKKIVVGNIIYQCEKGTKLTKINSNGDNIIIFDNTAEYREKMIFILVAAIIILVVTLGVVATSLKSKHNKLEKN